MTEAQQPKRRPSKSSLDPRVPPHNLDAEESALGAALLQTSAAEALVELVQPRDFYRPAHQHIAHAITKMVIAGDDRIDVVTVADVLRKDGLLEECGGAQHLLELQNATPAISNAAKYLRIVSDTASLRRLIETAAKITELGYNSDDPAAAKLQALNLIDAFGAGTTGSAGGMRAVALADFFTAGDSLEPDWVLAGWLGRRERYFLTGIEGAGKMVLIRQLVTKAAAGLHPWTDEPAPPVVAVLIDLENPHLETERWLMRNLLACPDGHDPTENLHIIERPEGLALHDPDDRAGDRRRLIAELDRIAPELIAIGPIYKAHLGGDPNVEAAMAPLAAFFDFLTHRYNAAIIIEGHPPHEANGRSRTTRPNGWSGWMRWPEFGHHIDRYHKVTTWRIDRIARRFPARLAHGTGDSSWPWQAVEWNDTDKAKSDTWRPTNLMEKISKFVEDHPGASVTEINDGVTGDKTTKPKALGFLIADGYIEPHDQGSGKRKEHHSIKPYREPKTTTPPDPPAPHLDLT